MRSLPMLLVICNLFIFITDTQAGAGSSWGYTGENSPDKWHEEYQQCGGKKQSPIDIITSKVVLNTKLGKLKLSEYDTVLREHDLTNNGHSAQVNIDADMYLEEGGLPGRYKAEQFHFHWGVDDRKGSEHEIDGQPFPMEMHIVHFSTDYANVSEASNKPDGLAVLAAFFKVVDKPNPNFEHIVNQFKGPLHAKGKLKIEDFTLRSLLPDKLDTFYRYSGSLTTPPCYESVVWTIYRDQVLISEDQLDKFRDNLKANTKSQPEERLVNDFRPIQSINVRLVESSTLEGTSGASLAFKSSITGYIILFCILHTFFVNLPSLA